MGKYIDLTNQKFGRLTVLHYINNGTWLCKCDCGNTKEVKGRNLRDGITKSCGCLYKTHGKSHDRIYHIYYAMKDRCYNKNNRRYKDYGANNITVCNEWLDNFMNFYNWAINNNYRDDLTIDRIDNNKGYSPDNCRWVDIDTQIANRRNTKFVTYKGETKTLAKWCEILNLKYKKIYKRLYELNWSIEKALEVK